MSPLRFNHWIWLSFGVLVTIFNFIGNLIMFHASDIIWSSDFFISLSSIYFYSYSLRSNDLIFLIYIFSYHYISNLIRLNLLEHTFIPQKKRVLFTPKSVKTWRWLSGISQSNKIELCKLYGISLLVGIIDDYYYYGCALAVYRSTFLLTKTITITIIITPSTINL